MGKSVKTEPKVKLEHIEPKQPKQEYKGQDEVKLEHGAPKAHPLK